MTVKLQVLAIDNQDNLSKAAWMCRSLKAICLTTKGWCTIARAQELMTY